MNAQTGASQPGKSPAKASSATSSGSGGCATTCREHEQRSGEQDDVGRTPHARLTARRGVEAPADVQQPPHGLHHRGERLAV